MSIEISSQSIQEINWKEIFKNQNEKCRKLNVKKKETIEESHPLSGAFGNFLLLFKLFLWIWWGM